MPLKFRAVAEVLPDKHLKKNISIVHTNCTLLRFMKFTVRHRKCAPPQKIINGFGQNLAWTLHWYCWTKWNTLESGISQNFWKNLPFCCRVFWFLEIISEECIFSAIREFCNPNLALSRWAEFPAFPVPFCAVWYCILDVVCLFIMDAWSRAHFLAKFFIQFFGTRNSVNQERAMFSLIAVRHSPVCSAPYTISLVHLQIR